MINEIYTLIQCFFAKKNHKPCRIIDHNDDEFDGWYIFDPLNPPSNCVIGACDTYDCGWIQDTVWWNSQEKTWMTTGSVISEPAHLSYSHWRNLNQPPKNKINHV